MKSDQYDLWRCAKCGRELTVPSHPHRSPRCCDTGMWWQHFVAGPMYDYEVTHTSK